MNRPSRYGFCLRWVLVALVVLAAWVGVVIFFVNEMSGRTEVRAYYGAIVLSGDAYYWSRTFDTIIVDDPEDTKLLIRFGDRDWIPVKELREREPEIAEYPEYKATVLYWGRQNEETLHLRQSPNVTFKNRGKTFQLPLSQKEMEAVFGKIYEIKFTRRYI